MTPWLSSVFGLGHGQAAAAAGGSSSSSGGGVVNERPQSSR